MAGDFFISGGDLVSKYWCVEEQNISCCITSLIKDRDHGVAGWDNTSK